MHSTRSCSLSPPERLPTALFFALRVLPGVVSPVAAAAYTTQTILSPAPLSFFLFFLSLSFSSVPWLVIPFQQINATAASRMYAASVAATPWGTTCWRHARSVWVRRITVSHCSSQFFENKIYNLKKLICRSIQPAQLSEDMLGPIALPRSKMLNWPLRYPLTTLFRPLLDVSRVCSQLSRSFSHWSLGTTVAVNVAINPFVARRCATVSRFNENTYSRVSAMC